MVKTFVTGVVLACIASGTASAQSVRPDAREQVQMRQRISTMEAILQRAVSNGADNVLRQVSTVMPDRPMLSGTPQVRGLRLDGYGMLFQVQVPQLILPIMWPFRQMVHDTQAVAAERMIQTLQREVATMRDPDERVRLLRVIREMEAAFAATSARPDSRGRVNAAALVPGAPAQLPPSVDSAVVDDPEGAYTREVKEALITAMLENSQALAIGADEWLTIAARDDEPRNPLFPGDTIDFSTWVIRVKGSELAAVRSGALSMAEARKRVEVREY
jgi:hypothetical protein